MSPEEQDKNLPSILGTWPNTYTFSKHMAEKTLQARRPKNLPCVLVRPSIIGCSYAEPSPGWTDTFSAAGGLTIAGSLGLINYVCGDGENIADIVPVDIVANVIITSTAMNAN